MRNKVGRLAALTALGTAILAVPASASASAADDVRNCLASFPAPGSTYVEYRYDNCGGRSIRSRVRLSGAPDEACHTLKLGQGYRDTWWVGSYDGIKAC
ncbi:hypothetical protein Areg01_77480 [Actinoplanes regularis]|nr:hypothetical protein Areg01_77480 [Actinoplanes regularis]